MDDSSAFVFSATARPELSRVEASPPSTGPRAGKAKKQTLSPKQLEKLKPLAASVLAVAILGAAALWERMPRARKPDYDLLGLRPAAAGVEPILPSRPAGGPAEPAPVSPSRPTMFVSFDELPDYGGARTPAMGDDVELGLGEERLRGRLRAEGKLPPEAGSMEDLRHRVESAGDALLRFASQGGGRP